MRAMVALMASLPLATLSEDVTTFYTIRDSDGADVDRALVKLSVKEKYKSALPYVKTSYVEHSSISDDHGRAQIKFPCWDGSFYATVEKDGYYPAEIGRVDLMQKPDEKHEKFWILPSKEIDVLLRKMVNPVPMYCHSRNIHSMRLHSPKGTLGYDLEKGDWVAPFGRGSVSDFNIEYDWVLTNGVFKGEGKLVFIEPGAGAYKRKMLVGNAFRIDYQADTNEVFRPSYPFSSYGNVKKVESREKRILENDEFLVMRTRVVVDSAGRVIKANYSHIEGPFSISNEMSYKFSSFNPAVNDTNLEYSPDKNLVPFKERR